MLATYTPNDEVSKEIQKEARSIMEEMGIDHGRYFAIISDLRMLEEFQGSFVAYFLDETTQQFHVVVAEETESLFVQALASADLSKEQYGKVKTRYIESQDDAWDTVFERLDMAP